MDLLITLCCEYIFNSNDCIEYLKSININPEQYEFVYKEYYIHKPHGIKSARKLIGVDCSNLSKYRNIMLVSLRQTFNNNIQLPPSVTYFITGYCCKTLPVLPRGLVYLKIGSLLNHDVNDLPERLRYLSIPYDKHKVQFPDKLHSLQLYCYASEIPTLPIMLRRLCIYKNKINMCLPDELEYLRCGGRYLINKLPTNLKTLITSNSKMMDRNPPPRQKKIIFPNGLTKFHWCSVNDIAELPPGLKQLVLGPYSNNYDGIIPSGLTHLSCDSEYINTKFQTFPKTLTHFAIGFYCIHVIKRIPEDITHFKWHRNKKLPRLPSTLTHLELGEMFKQKVDVLPINIKHISYHKDYKYAKELRKMYGDNVCYSVYNGPYGEYGYGALYRRSGIDYM
jgi:hypothetical protein